MRRNGATHHRGENAWVFNSVRTELESRLRMDEANSKQVSDLTSVGLSVPSVKWR